MLHLTRAQLSERADVNALLPLIRPARGRVGAQHHLIWSLMSDGEDRQRDFIYRQDGRTTYVLSERQPAPSDLWDAETKQLPEIATGTQLAFMMRCNPVQRIVSDDGKRRKVDVVMHALHSIEKSQRALRRMEIAQQVMCEWLGAQGADSGFELHDCVIESYRQQRISRGRGRPIQFSTVDLQGALTVTDGALFADRLKHGFGSSRAWGCGLMLVRRVR